MANMVSTLGGAFLAGAKARAAFQFNTFRGLIGAGEHNMAIKYLGASRMPAMRRGAMIGAGLGAASAANNDRRNGRLGIGTPLHMMWGGATGAVKGGMLGGLGGAVFGTRAARASEAMRQYSRGGF